MKGKTVKVILFLIGAGCLFFGVTFIRESMDAELKPGRANTMFRYLKETGDLAHAYEMDNSTLLKTGEFWITPLLNSKHTEKVRSLILSMDMSEGVKKQNEPVLYGSTKDKWSRILKVYDSWGNPIRLKREAGRTLLISAGKDGNMETVEDNISSIDSGVDTEVYPDPFMGGDRGVIGLVMCAGGGFLLLSTLAGLMSKKRTT